MKKTAARASKKAAALIVILVMILTMIPVTAKPVQAATYPTAHDIMLCGKRLDAAVPSGVSYNEATGVLRLENFGTDNYNERLQVGGVCELTIELVGNSNILSSSVCPIQADNCSITFCGSGSLVLDTYLNKNGGDPVFGAGIVARDVTVKDSVGLTIHVTNTDDSKTGNCYGIKASGNLTITDSAFVNVDCKCSHEHTKSAPDVGLAAAGKIDISTTREITCQFTQYGTHFEDRYGLYGSDLSITNCPAFIVYSGNLTSKDGWKPDGYSATEDFVDPNWIVKFIPTPRVYHSVAGKDRYETAAEIARSTFQFGPPDEEVIIVTGKKFPDALAANSYAGVAEAPILLSGTDKLNEATRKLMVDEWGGVVSKVTVIGGEFGVGFYNDLAGIGFTEAGHNLKKIYGNDRYQTAEAVTEATLELAASKSIEITAVAVATGQNPSDALSFSPWAYSKHIPILLVSNGEASESTKKKIADFPYVFLLGDEAVCSASCLAAGQPYMRLSGLNRFETSEAIAKFFVESTGSGTYDGTGFADGTYAHFPDALAGGMMQGHLNAPILLTSESSSAELYVKPFIQETLAKKETRGFNFYFLGWSAKGNSTEYDTLVKWIESND